MMHVLHSMVMLPQCSFTCLASGPREVDPAPDVDSFILFKDLCIQVQVAHDAVLTPPMNT